MKFLLPFHLLVEKDGEIYAQNDALSIKLNAGDCGALTSNGYIGNNVYECSTKWFM